MNKSLITGLLAGAVVAAAAGALAGYKLTDARPAYAQVVDVKPVEKTVRTPRQQCHEEAVTRQAPTKDAKQVAGAVFGAVVGGVIQKRMQSGRTVTITEQRCETVYDTHIERTGYDVRYRVGPEEGTVRMNHDPGDRIPLRAGQLVLDARTGSG